MGGGAGSPGVHVEFDSASRTAFSLTAGLNRVYSGYYVQAGGKIYFNPKGVGPYAHITGTYGSGKTHQAQWQTGELGVALGTAWRLSERFLVNVELGYAVGDGVSYAPGGFGNTDAFSPSGRFILGWRLLFGG